MNCVKCIAALLGAASVLFAPALSCPASVTEPGTETILRLAARHSVYSYEYLSELYRSNELTIVPLQGECISAVKILHNQETLIVDVCGEL